MEKQLVIRDMSDWSDRENGTKVLYAILAEGETAIATAKLLHKPEYGENVFCVSFIDVRPEERKKGNARTLLNLVAEKKGYILASSGGYTPEGYAAFKDFPLLPGKVHLGKPSYDSMDFIQDWGVQDEWVSCPEIYGTEIIPA